MTKPEPIRVLLLAGNEDHCRLVHALLEEFRDRNYVLHWASDGRQAAERAPAGGFDVCLIDGPPDAHGGIESLARLGPRGCPPPVVVLTDQAGGSIDDPAPTSGPVDLLVKDRTDAAALDRAIRRALERRRIEEQSPGSDQWFRALFQACPLGILELELDAEGRPVIVEANPAAERFASAEARTLVGRPFAEALPALAAACPPDRCRAAALRGVPWSVTDLARADRPGSETCDLHAFQTAPGRLALILLDTTERRRAAEALCRAREEAEAANRARSEFLANVSHELRTPLTSILGFAEVLGEQAGPDASPGQVEAAEIIQRNGQHLLAVLDDLRDLSRVEAGHVSIQRVRHSPFQAIAEVVSLMQVRAASRALSFHIEYRGRMPEWIRTDPTRLRQILINVVENAINFTQRGGVRMIIRCVKRDSPLLQFDVVDTGIGMSEQEVARLFRPFARAGLAPQGRPGGTGLGLTVSRQLARMLGGDVQVVETRPEGGTRVRVTVETGPLEGVRMIDDPLTASAIAPRASNQRDGADTADLHGRRILLAEDGPDNQRLIAHLLRRAGAEVTIAENGQLAVDAALSAAEQGRAFDAVLMDVQMPVMDGHQATRLLRSRGYRLPIIALTAHALPGDREACLEAGCDDYASKPVHRHRLMEILGRHAGAAAAAACPTGVSPASS